jgi:hypothetical protein
MNAAALSVGTRVYHERFGEGDVIGKGRKNSVLVDFGSDHGHKHIVRDFLEMRRPTAEIIAFPTHRIVRRIEHGQGVVVNR